MTPKNLKDEDIKNFKVLLDFFRQLSADGVSLLIEKQLISMLDNSIPFFSHLIMKDVFPEIHRLTVNSKVTGQNKRISDINFLKYPPADKVTKYGRCNLPNQSILYASFFKITTMSELKPRIGDLITETTWKVKNNESLIYCPIFKNQPTKKDFINPRTFEINQVYEQKLKDYPEKVREQIDALVQFVADNFTKRVHPERHQDYIFSAYFSNKIFTHFENGTIEAIYYPSVQDGLSFENLAIKSTVFDNKYQLAEVKDSVVVVDPSTGGGYFMEGLSECKNFDFVTNKVLWDKNKIYQSADKIADLNKRYGVDLTE